MESALQPPATKRKIELPSLTGLRFFAAYAIVLHHLLLHVFRSPPGELKSLLSTCGQFGMSLFFILSGFIIHFNYSGQLTNFSLAKFWNFIAARIARLYPLFLCFLAFDLLVGWKWHQVSWALLKANLPWFLTLTHSWFYVLNGNMPTFSPFNFSNVTWSISTEFCLYFLYPIFLFGFRRVKSLSSNIAIMLTLIVLQRIIMQVLQHNSSGLENWGVTVFGAEAGQANAEVYRFYSWLMFNSPATRVFEFLIGISICQVYWQLTEILDNQPSLRIVNGLIWASLGWLLSSFALPAFANQQVGNLVSKLGLQPAIAVLILLLPLSKNWLRTIMENRVSLFLGETSYSIYLVHGPILAQAHFALWSDLSYEQKILTVFAVPAISLAVFATSILTYKGIENPGRKLLRNWLTTSPRQEAHVSIAKSA